MISQARETRSFLPRWLWCRPRAECRIPDTIHHACFRYRWRASKPWPVRRIPSYSISNLALFNADRTAALSGALSLGKSRAWWSDSHVAGRLCRYTSHPRRPLALASSLCSRLPLQSWSRYTHAVHAPLERDAFHFKAASCCVPKFPLRSLACCSIGFASLLHQGHVAALTRQDYAPTEGADAGTGDTPSNWCRRGLVVVYCSATLSPLCASAAPKAASVASWKPHRMSLRLPG